MTDNYEIRTLRPAPSMQEDISEFSGTYAEACAEARRVFAETNRRTSVVSMMQYWYLVSSSGCVNRNTNSII